MLHWYIFQSKTRKEDLLCEQLRIREIELFFPRLNIRPVNPRARKVKPYFPGYVFARVDLEDAGRSILDWIPGAVGIVSFGGEPAPVPDHLVTTLRQHIDTVNAANRQVLESYQPGDVVAIRSGPFTGYEAIFDVHLPGRDRVEVLLRLIQGSHQIRLELPLEFITLKTEFMQPG
ncbi:MAG TPA: transcription termination/antitermination NusG family protein [Anaerolineales bacterium]|nr:transcription termination/antitermination NusG family protein [Anaerolineales bacterium]